jgi:Helix-turn-helix domain
VAALLFVDRKTVSRWAQSGRLGSFRTPGGNRRYLKSEIMAILDGDFDHHDHPQDSVAVPSPRRGDPFDPVPPSGEISDAAAKAVVAEAVAIALEAEAAETAQAMVVIAAAVALAATNAAARRQDRADGGMNRRNGIAQLVTVIELLRSRR